MFEGQYAARANWVKGANEASCEEDNVDTERSFRGIANTALAADRRREAAVEKRMANSEGCS